MVDVLKDWANKKLDNMNDGMKYRLGKMGDSNTMLDVDVEGIKGVV